MWAVFDRTMVVYWSRQRPEAAIPAPSSIEIRTLIEEARRQTAVAVNIGLTLLYWRIGRRIHREVLGNEHAAYGEQIVVTLSRQLGEDYGRGYSLRPQKPWQN